MADTRFTCNANTTYELRYFLLWCTKWRRPVLTEKIAAHTEKLLQAKATELDVHIHNLAVRTDQVRVILSSDPTEAPQRIVNALKGHTSHVLRGRYHELRKLPTLWTRSYYATSVGAVAKDAVASYLEKQTSI